MKLYDLGLVLGRFQMFHKGHQSMIQHSLELCEHVVVFIGSSQKASTKENPFSYDVRAQMIEAVFPVEYKTGKIIVRPLPDIGAGNNAIWGNYVLSVFSEEFGKQPDVYITGCEKERCSWFTDELAPHMDELRISRKNIAIAARTVREYLLKDDKEKWLDATPYQLHKDYDFYHRVVLTVKDK